MNLLRWGASRDEPSETKVVIIVAHGRSGSTLVQALCNSIQGWRVSGENFSSVLHSARAVASAKYTRERHGGGARGVNHPRFGADCVDVERFREGMRNLIFEAILNQDSINPGSRHRVVGFKEIR